jgi:hypothetical protein
MIALLLAAVLASPPIDTFPPIMEDDPQFNCALNGNHVCSDEGIPHIILWTQYTEGTINV